MPVADLVLASASGKRAQLLAALQVSFSIHVSKISEGFRQGEKADQAALRLAAAKADSVGNNYPQAVVVAADTCIQVDGRIAGKPADRENAGRMLKSCSGRQASVYTALCVSGNKGISSLLRVGRLDFRIFADEQIDFYLDASPGALQAEGAFAVDEAGALLCAGISEDEPGTIAGLPMISLCRMLAKQGVELP